MDRKMLESILQENGIPFDEHLDAYHGFDDMGNDILVNFGNDDTCYVCVTDDVLNDSRGYATDVPYEFIKVTADQIDFGVDGIILMFEDTCIMRKELQELLEDYRVEALSDFYGVDTYWIIYEEKRECDIYEEPVEVELQLHPDRLRMIKHPRARHPKVRDYSYADIVYQRCFTIVKEHGRQYYITAEINLENEELLKLCSFTTCTD